MFTNWHDVHAMETPGGVPGVITSKCADDTEYDGYAECAA
jgi:hypothetical protein